MAYMICFLLLFLVTQILETAVSVVVKRSKRLNAKQLLFGIRASPTFQLHTHEHSEVGKTTSELWKWDHPRSP